MGGILDFQGGDVVLEVELMACSCVHLIDMIVDALGTGALSMVVLS